MNSAPCSQSNGLKSSQVSSSQVRQRNCVCFDFYKSRLKTSARLRDPVLPSSSMLLMQTREGGAT